MQPLFKKNIKAPNPAACSLYERLRDQILINGLKKENQRIKLDYPLLTLQLKYSRRQLTRHIRELELAGLIKRYSIPSEIIKGKAHKNIMYIELIDEEAEETGNKKGAAK